MTRRPLLLAALLALAGCGTAPSLPSPAAHPETAISVTREQNGRFLAFVSPAAQHDPPFLGVRGTNIDVLRGWLDTKTGEVVNQLYVEDSYYGPKRTWNAASDGAGKPLRFIKIRSDEITCENGSCAYAEEFAAALPEDLLRASKGGFKVVFGAEGGGRMIVAISGDTIVNQLAAIDSARAGIAPPPTAAK